MKLTQRSNASAVAVAEAGLAVLVDRHAAAAGDPVPPAVPTRPAAGEDAVLLVGRVGELLGQRRDVVPGPCLVVRLDAGLLEHGLVVEPARELRVGWQAVQ